MSRSVTSIRKKLLDVLSTVDRIKLASRRPGHLTIPLYQLNEFLIEFWDSDIDEVIAEYVSKSLTEEHEVKRE